jgi:predicted phosphodiesterase
LPAEFGADRLIPVSRVATRVDWRWGVTAVRTAIVSDIHGNLTALEAVLAELKAASPDQILHGGDLAHGGSRSAEVIDRIRDLGWHGVCGNTDQMLWAPEELHKFAAALPKLQRLFATIDEMIPATCAQHGQNRIEWLKTLPRLQRRGPLALVHARPDDLWRAPLRDADDQELNAVFKPLDASVAVYGHIHEPFIRKLQAITVANAGSVGLSYDGDTRASYLMVDDAEVSIHRVEYDIEREAQALMRSGLPHADWVCQTLRAGRYLLPA